MSETMDTPLLLGSNRAPLTLDGAGKTPLLMRANIITPPGDLAFNYMEVNPTVPGINDQFDNMGVARDFPDCVAHQTQSFRLWRWQPTWMRADGFYGSWEPAEGEIWRIYRKGATAPDDRILVLECGPNPAAIPVGNAVVLWRVDYNGGVDRFTTHLALPGYNLPLRQKLTVSGGQGSAQWDANGRRLVEIDTGQALPAIDWTAPTFVEGGVTWSRYRLRHWEFYADPATKRMRSQIGWNSQVLRDQALAAGGYVMLGGLQFIPTWRDWTLEYRDFGASLTEELWRKECEGLADFFGNTDPRRLAVELENEPTREWNDVADGVGYGTLLPDVWYGIAREVWGPERTLVVKATSFGTLDSLRDEFDWPCPPGDNAHLVTHNYNGQAHMGPGGPLISWWDWDQANYYAGVLKQKITDLGYKGGGMTECGHWPWEWWDFNLAVSTAERGRRLGRILTALSSQGLYCCLWGMTGDQNRLAEVYTDIVPGKRIQALWPDMRPYLSRAGLPIP